MKHEDIKNETIQSLLAESRYAETTFQAEIHDALEKGDDEYEVASNLFHAMEHVELAAAHYKEQALTALHELGVEPCGTCGRLVSIGQIYDDGREDAKTRCSRCLD